MTPTREQSISEYTNNLNALKALIDQYTIADLRSMIYDIPVKRSGACCYPAMQTLLSLMELIGKLLRDKEGQEAIQIVLGEMGGRYNQHGLARSLYEKFRHGIAHSSLAKGGVGIRKDGERNWHLSDTNKIDVMIFFEDFFPIYERVFNETLRDSNRVNFYSPNLRKLLRGLETPWLNNDTSSFIPSRLENIFRTPGSSGASGMRGPTRPQQPTS